MNSSSYVPSHCDDAVRLSVRWRTNDVKVAPTESAASAKRKPCCRASVPLAWRRARSGPHAQAARDLFHRGQTTYFFSGYLMSATALRPSTTSTKITSTSISHILSIMCPIPPRMSAPCAETTVGDSPTAVGATLPNSRSTIIRIVFMRRLRKIRRMVCVSAELKSLIIPPQRR